MSGSLPSVAGSRSRYPLDISSRSSARRKTSDKPSLGAPTILALLLIVAICALGVIAPVRRDLVIRSRGRRLIVVRVPTPPVLAAAIFRLRLVVHIAACQQQRTAFTRHAPAGVANDIARPYKIKAATCTSVSRLIVLSMAVCSRSVDGWPSPFPPLRTADPLARAPSSLKSSRRMAPICNGERPHDRRCRCRR